MGKGTEAFPDLGEHCQQEDCNQLDFLPFTCNACRKVFCLEHRSFEAHSCPNAEHDSRVVVVCQVCSVSMEKKASEEESLILEQHLKSGDCNALKKKKPKCPVRRCKEVLTFSNTAACKTCNLKVCLKHRFPSDHGCKPVAPVRNTSKQLLLLPARSGTGCRDIKPSMPSKSSITVH